MKTHIVRYIKAVLFNLGLSTLGMTVCIMLAGDRLKGLSTLGSLGSEGVPVRVIFQLLLVNLTVNALGRLFLSDLLIKDMKPSLRIILATGCAFLAVLGALTGFGWLPLHERDTALAVIIFAVFFPCVFICSARRFIRREQEENQKLAEALQRYKSA